eukprot:g76189.t1
MVRSRVSILCWSVLHRGCLVRSARWPLFLSCAGLRVAYATCSAELAGRYFSRACRSSSSSMSSSQARSVTNVLQR